ncbi:MAG TPA: HlyD family efflux transporter periplasmic adaptor subunit [Caldithrix abyssi]|uniref:HlyD family efflux transporter periplasmic adaptor subunit n=1 Tax=Caldithrix abyssi TaxID=187145 RepID=A0A7V5UEG8_CALAY|nr:HlyD family efflux transporter periplasmic adaptor subunit [Caldithrix abyssi]
MTGIKAVLPLMIVFAFVACDFNGRQKAGYDGRLDVTKIRLSAKTGGTVDSLFAAEGDRVQAGQLLAVLESDRLRLQLQSKMSQQEELKHNLDALKAQLEEAEARLNLAQTTLAKTTALLAKGAATDQKKDELETQVKSLRAKKKIIRAQMQSLQAKQKQLAAAIELAKLALKDARIYAPQNGVVVNRFVNEHELAAPGTALFELADLSQMEATVYVPLVDLDEVRVGQQAELTIDGSDQVFKGKVKWISSEAEFTPKTILTKETRTTLVYAVKIDVPNPEGKLKIGMPVQVRFQK